MNDINSVSYSLPVCVTCKTSGKLVKIAKKSFAVCVIYIVIP